MGSGIRAEVSLDAEAECPVARASASAGAPAESVSWSAAEEGTITEEFAIDGDVEEVEIETTDETGIETTEETGIETTEETGGGTASDADVEAVFTSGSRTIYRFERGSEAACPCECVERLGQPIDEVFTEDGRLHLVFHAPGIDGLREVIGTLRERFDGVEVRRLVRSGDAGEGSDLVFVDRGALTDRQREVLEVAHEMGYFEHPKGANAGEVADALDITTSTFTEHLAAAQRKILSAVLSG